MKKMFWLVALTLSFIIAACGGSAPSGGNGNNGNGSGDVTVTVTAEGAAASAYRIGNGAWQAAADPASFTFTVSGGGSYDVVAYCSGYLNISSFTTDDSKTPDVSCVTTSDVEGASFDIKYDVSGVTGAVAARIFYKGVNFMGEGGGKTGTHQVDFGIAGKQDLVVVALDGSRPPRVLAAKMVTVTVANGGTYKVPPLNDGDSVNTASFPSFSGQVPSGYTPSWSVASATPNGTLVIAGLESNSGGRGSTYYLYPFTSRRLFGAFAEKASDYSVSGIFSSASGVPAITLPEPIDPAVDGSPVSISGLSVPSDLVGYDIMANWPGGYVFAFVSKSYLGNSTSYTLPDLAGLSGFGNTKPASGDTVEVTVKAVRSDLRLSELYGLGIDGPYDLPAGHYYKAASKKAQYKYTP